MRELLLLAAIGMMLGGCATYEGGTEADSGVIRGTEGDESTSDFGRGEGWRNTRDAGDPSRTTVIRDPRPAGGFHQ